MWRQIFYWTAQQIFSVVVFCLLVCLANVFIWLQVFFCLLLLLSFMIFHVMLLYDVFVWIFRYKMAFCLDGVLFASIHSHSHTHTHARNINRYKIGWWYWNNKHREGSIKQRASFFSLLIFYFWPLFVIYQLLLVQERH